MIIELDADTVALLARYAAARNSPADHILAGSVLAAALFELVPQAERLAQARRAAADHRTEHWHG